jgi:hypothetical protein
MSIWYQEPGDVCSMHKFDGGSIHRMDPNSSYLLKIRLTGNPKKRRKEFSCFNITKVVDSDVCNFKDLVEEIVDKYPHGYNEIVHVFYYDNVEKTFPQITTDQELLKMFSKHADSKVVCMTITYTEPTDDVPIPKCYADEVLDIPDTPSMACPSLVVGSQLTEPTSQPTKPCTSKPSIDQDGDDDYLANPEPHNEHVGVDDEILYLANLEPYNEHVGVSRAHQNVSEGSDSESGSESDEEYEEEDGLIGKDPPPPMPIICYDKLDPPMSVGSIYPNMQAFKLALSQHAVNHEFEFNTEKSDPGRLRAYCSRKREEGCRWRIHASTMKDNVTIKVIYVV